MQLQPRWFPISLSGRTDGGQPQRGSNERGVSPEQSRRSSLAGSLTFAH